jgi:hypothetical protein
VGLAFLLPFVCERLAMNRSTMIRPEPCLGSALRPLAVASSSSLADEAGQMGDDVFLEPRPKLKKS